MSIAAVLSVFLSTAFADEPPPVESGLGKGVIVRNANGDSFQVRARAQLRASVIDPGPEEESTYEAVQVRRARLVFVGKSPSRHLQFNVQLGLAPQDLETDYLSALRDAYVTWNGNRDLSVRFGQMKVPFNIELMTSSAYITFPDRSITSNELTLDRDIGVYVYSTDLFGAGDRLGYYLGVFNGDGRNRLVKDLGPMFLARVEVRPFGKFEDASSESDISRDPAPRLQIAASAARNFRSHRERSTAGATFADQAFDYDHAEAEVLLHVAGLSVHGEGLARRAGKDYDGFHADQRSKSAWGYSAMVGYVLPSNTEPVARIAGLAPMHDRDTAELSARELRFGVNQYFVGHDLKVTGEFVWLTGDQYPGPGGTKEYRVQTQVFF